MSETDSKRLLEMLQGLHRQKPDVIPEGFRTSESFAQEWGCSRGKANALLGAGIDKGIVERRDFLVLFPVGLRKVTYYRVDASKVAEA